MRRELEGWVWYLFNVARMEISQAKDIWEKGLWRMALYYGDRLVRNVKHRVKTLAFVPKYPKHRYTD